MSGCRGQVWKGFHSQSCARKAVKDGYCKQHHPDVVAVREAKADAQFEQRRTARLAPFATMTAERDRLLERVKVLEGALTHLANAVSGLRIAEDLLRQGVGNTNYHCLMEREREARAALEAK